MLGKNSKVACTTKNQTELFWSTASFCSLCLSCSYKPKNGTGSWFKPSLYKRQKTRWAFWKLVDQNSSYMVKNKVEFVWPVLASVAFQNHLATKRRSDMIIKPYADAGTKPRPPLGSNKLLTRCNRYLAVGSFTVCVLTKK